MTKGHNVSRDLHLGWLALVKLNLEYLKEIITLVTSFESGLFNSRFSSSKTYSCDISATVSVGVDSYTSLDFPVWQEEVGEVVEDTSASAEQWSPTWLRGSST